jgi:hypothetical protein
VTILYVETNFVVAIAKGQDTEVDRLLESPPHSTQIHVPSACLIEALATLKTETKQRAKFVNELSVNRREAQRDSTSENAASLVFHLNEAIVKSQELLNDVRGRLNKALVDLTVNAQILPVGRSMIEDAFNLTVLDDAMDRLILSCILDHASSTTSGSKAFLSANSRDFGHPGVKGLLSAAGVSYFESAGRFVDGSSPR